VFGQDPYVRQRFAAVCRNGHIATDFLEGPVRPGSHPDVPVYCRRCSAPVTTTCTWPDCDAPINGDKETGVVVLTAKARADWFCHRCARPYDWAKPAQLRDWALNQIRFNESLPDEDADELLGLVAALTSPDEDEQTQQRTYVQFRERVKGLGEVAQSLEPVVRLLRLALTG
jgi:hypothetical protein